MFFVRSIFSGQMWVKCGVGVKRPSHTSPRAVGGAYTDGYVQLGFRDFLY
jgi:hypothetical protein